MVRALSQINDPDKNKKTAIFHQFVSTTFSPGKFIPTQINPLRHLFRGSALRPLISLNHSNSNLIFIQAQAGQGKSTLAAQFLHYIRADFAWIRVDREDRDPVVFITALFAALYRDFPDLENATLLQAIINGEIDGENPERLALSLLTEITPLLTHDYYLVLDDLHIINTSANSLNFLKLLADHIPRGLHLVLLSRNPLEGFTNNFLYLDNNDLALSKIETHELFKNIFKLNLPPKMVTQLHHKTEGWIMGLVMAKHVLSDHRLDPSSGSWNFQVESRANQFHSYFKKEILSSISLDQQRILASLALLEDIPAGLAQRITQSSKITFFLDHLVQNNFFVHRIEGSPPIYYFHHLLKEFLESHALRHLSARQRCIILAKAGHWHLRSGRKEPALRYYMRAKSYRMANNILRDIGLYLIATDRMATLKEIIRNIPHDVVRAYPWLSLIIAEVYFHNDPFQCEVYLQQARRKFIEHHDAFGEFLTLTKLIRFHAGIDCRFNRGKILLPRAEELQELLWNSLPDVARILSSNAIAFGLCYFVGRMRQADDSVSLMYRLAEEKNMDNTMAEVMIIRGVISSLQGNWTTFRQHIEVSQPLLLSPRVSSFSKMILFSQQLALLGLEGDFIAYKIYKERITTLIDSHLLAKSICGPLLLVADINNSLAQGRPDEAEAFVEQGLNSGGSGQSTHLKSLFTAYRAYLFALSGEKTKALAAAKASLYLRKDAQGAYHEMVTQMLLGAVCTLLNMTRRAELFLSNAISGLEKLGDMFVRVSAYAHRATLHLARNKTQAALEDIGFLLKAMKAHHYRFFHTWNPKAMEKILTAACVHGVEFDFAQKLANERLLLTITPEGIGIPILEINTLGLLELRLNGEVKAGFKDFTAGQRELLALLASAPKEGISLEIIQVAFWPESPPHKIRSRFDNFLGNLRSVLNSKLSPCQANDYVSTEKGFLRLKNCRIDADSFLREVSNGLSHLELKEYWQASNAFLRANIWYRGEFMAGVRLKKQAVPMRETLHRSFLNSTLQWVEILNHAQRFDDAIALCRKALEHDPTFQPLVKSLYHLFTQINSPDKASELISKYKNDLAAEGFPPTKIDVILDHFWT